MMMYTWMPHVYAWGCPTYMRGASGMDMERGGIGKIIAARLCFSCMYLGVKGVARGGHVCVCACACV